SLLSSAWVWGGAGLALWGFALISDTLPWDFSEVREFSGIADQLWYLATLLVMAAGIAVLGARRPGSHVWSWFVVLPMLLVLGWPCLFFWGNGWPPPRFSLMLPAFLAVCLVLIMSAGNYLGTRFSTPALCTGLACLLVILPRTPWGWNLVPYEDEIRALATLLMAGSVLFAARSLPTPAASRLEHFWLDFRDWFGIVWASRVQERLNEEARRLRWPFRFHGDGVFFAEEDANAHPRRFDLSLKNLPPEVIRDLETTLIWVFRRFVDPPWINARLGEELQIQSDSPLEQRD
ncbi:MAG: hypothetical protein U0903_18000, partial [Planctomycetales bacterium]